VLAGEVCSLTQKPYPLRLILKVVGYSSSAWYARPSGDLKQRPGPRPAIGDDQALELITCIPETPNKPGVKIIT